MAENTVTLGGEEFEVTAPPLGSLVEFVEAVDTLGSNSFTNKTGYDALMVVLKLGLTTKASTVLERIGQLPVTLQELRDAVEVILTASGLRMGEAPAQQGPGVIDQSAS